jgi:hypothetical protein
MVQTLNSVVFEPMLTIRTQITAAPALVRKSWHQQFRQIIKSSQLTTQDLQGTFLSHRILSLRDRSESVKLRKQINKMSTFDIQRMTPLLGADALLHPQGRCGAPRAGLGSLYG